uniref:Uncharacterized protein n=1 Tax=Catagonus wagneri TaxID=51154 RepID=A0A8C3YET9_9CETA
MSQTLDVPQRPGHQGGRSRGASSFSRRNMTADTGATVLVLLLCCWQGADLRPMRLLPVSSIKLLANLRKLNDNAHLASSTGLPAYLRSLNDDVATVFDEILVQEILEPNKSALSKMQTAGTTLSMRTFKEKTRIKTNHQTDTETRKYEDQFSAEKENRLFVNEEDKEILYQIKSLAALEKIIESLQRALGNSLKERRRKNKSVFKGGRHYRGNRA